MGTLDNCDYFDFLTPNLTAKLLAPRHANGGLAGPGIRNVRWPLRGGRDARQQQCKRYEDGDRGLFRAILCDELVARRNIHGGDRRDRFGTECTTVCHNTNSAHATIGARAAAVSSLGRRDAAAATAATERSLAGAGARKARLLR